MNINYISIDQIKLNGSNPRIIKDDKFRKLVKSIKDFPQMLEIRPIVVNAEMVVLGGNMRLRACKEAGLKQVPIIKAEDLTIEQQREFIIKDNVGFGEWYWDQLANEWDAIELMEWGLDVPSFEEIDAQYIEEAGAKEKDPSITITFKDPEVMQKAEIVIHEAIDGRFADALITVNFGKNT